MHLKTDTSSNAHFAQVPNITKPRNAFTIAEKHVTTIGFDKLYPLYWKYIYPGDTLSISHSMLARLNTQITTLYDDLYFDLHAWFVPFRLIQTNWARYQFNAQPAGPTQDNSALTSPKIDLTTLVGDVFVHHTLYDYLGFPVGVDLDDPAITAHINNYLGRAYNLIWNENYRDQNLQTPVVVDLDDGPDSVLDYVLKKRGRRHDLFSSSLTAAQKGAAVTMPLGTSAPITYVTGNVPNIRDATTGALRISGGNINSSPSGAAQDGAVNVLWDPNGSLIANLATATAASVNQLRQSIAIQQLLEADARGGTRDVESIQHRWGVTVPDFRLQRPEYLGGQTFTFDGHIVPQTSETTGVTTAQGKLVQFSQALNSFNINHSFVEHGAFMILVSCRSNITYQYGLQRELSYRTRYDWYQPEFANLGEVAVLNKEIYMGLTDTANNGVWGYQEYGYELRYSLNKVTCEMRSNYSASLDSKHMADEYASLPTLGSAWIESNTPIDRNIIVASGTADPIELSMLTSGKIARTLPMYSIPGLMRL